MSSRVLKALLLTCIDKVQETGLIGKAVEWILTGGTNLWPFYIHSSDPGQHQLIVAAEEQLYYLGQSDTWFTDGNYAMSLSIF